MRKSKSSLPIRLLLVDDHFVVREGIRSCLAGHTHLIVVGEASNGKEAIAKARKLKPDLVLMDINMPEMNGTQATRELLRTMPAIKVLILTVHDRQEYVTQLMQAGARGYVLKDTSPDNLLRAIETVHSGNGFYSSVAPTTERTGETSTDLNSLSARELEVLSLVAQGRSSKDIALKLDVTLRTIKTYRERVMRKLDLHSATELAAYAAHHGLLPADGSGN